MSKQGWEGEATEKGEGGWEKWQKAARGSIGTLIAESKKSLLIFGRDSKEKMLNAGSKKTPSGRGEGNGVGSGENVKGCGGAGKKQRPGRRFLRETKTEDGRHSLQERGEKKTLFEKDGYILKP